MFMLNAIVARTTENLIKRCIAPGTLRISYRSPLPPALHSSFFRQPIDSIKEVNQTKKGQNLSPCPQ
jgi:hypothetical protein